MHIYALNFRMLPDPDGFLKTWIPNSRCALRPILSFQSQTHPSKDNLSPMGIQGTDC